ncbi:MAG: major facilitator superfamily 1 [Pseudonocardiales bacterium]|nr:major facilitator superfamily 1 [Pseudonocardiales bacterium]
MGAAEVDRRPSALYGSLVAHAVSIIGTRVSTIALPWFVLTTTGSATKTGLVALFQMAPLVIAKALGGPLIDRIGPRRVSIVCDSVSAVVVAFVPLLHFLGGLSFPVLLVLVALSGALRGPGDTAKETITPDIADVAGVDVERVTGLSGTTDRAAMIVGPARAGGLIAWVGPVNAIAVDAASFAICAALIWVFAPVRPPAASSAESLEEGLEAELTYLAQLRSGWSFLARDPLLRTVSGLVAVTNLLDAAYAAVLLPVWIREHGLGTAELGFIGSAFGLTATVASLLAALYGTRINRRLAFTVGFLLAGAPRFVALAVGAPLWCVIGVGALAGLGAGFLNPILSAIYIQRTPRDLLGRVVASSDGVAWAGIPFGGVLAGAGIALIGLAPVLLVAGGIYLVTTMAPVLTNFSAQMDARAPSVH